MVNYIIGKPPKTKGVYACRIPHRDNPEQLLEDIFLFWDGKKWGYLSSDQNYRGTVLGWIGPLQRKFN